MRIRLVPRPVPSRWWGSEILEDAPIEFQIYGGGFQAGVSSSLPGRHIMGDKRECISPFYLREWRGGMGLHYCSLVVSVSNNSAVNCSLSTFLKSLALCSNVT
jgi:hypothetical protein